MYLPVNINLKNKKCIIIGGGDVAYRKTKTLLDYGAKITLISPEIKNDKLKKIIDEKKIKFKNKKYKMRFFKKAFLVVAATDNKKLNKKITGKSNNMDILVNNASGKGSLNFPAVLTKGEIKIAISTNGSFPGFSKMMKDKLCGIIPGDYEGMLLLLREYRKNAKKHIKNKEDRKLFLNEMLVMAFKDMDDMVNLNTKINKIFLKYTDKT